MRSESWFAKLDRRVARASGRPLATMLAFAVIFVWLTTGPIFRYSDTWQLVINTGTSIITFVMVFLIQGSQNRDAEALQIKIDELIRAIKLADNTLLNLEELDEDALDRIRLRYSELAEEARKAQKKKQANRRRER